MSEDNITKLDRLTTDDPIHGQTYYLISFLSPEGIQNNPMRGVKVRGVYGTYDDAKKAAEDLQKKDPYFDIFIGEVGKWSPWNPETSNMENKYAEQELQTLMDKYLENQMKAKRAETERRNDILAKSIEQNRKAKSENKRENIINKNKANNFNSDNKKPITNEELKLREQKAELAKQKLLNENKELDKTKNELMTVDENISALKNYVNNLKMKKMEKI